jgi:hypothetical protein
MTDPSDLALQVTKDVPCMQYNDCVPAKTCLYQSLMGFECNPTPLYVNLNQQLNKLDCRCLATSTRTAFGTEHLRCHGEIWSSDLSCLVNQKNQ